MSHYGNRLQWGKYRKNQVVEKKNNGVETRPYLKALVINLLIMYIKAFIYLSQSAALKSHLIFPFISQMFINGNVITMGTHMFFVVI